MLRRTALLLSFATAPLLGAMGACSDDDSGGNNTGGGNNNHHVTWDAATQHDSSVQWDAAVQWDGAPVQQDGAPVQQDAGEQNPDSGTPGAGNIGDPCTGDTDCTPPAGLTAKCLQSSDFQNMIKLPGGYCSATCTPGNPDPCGPGAVCYNAVLGTYCLKSCTDNSECRESEGYICTDPLQHGETVCATQLGGFGP